MSAQHDSSNLERTQRERLLTPPAKSPSRDWGTVGLVALLVVFLGGLALAVGWLVASTRIMPGVEVLGLPLGGLSRRQAAVALQEHWDRQTVVLELGTDTWTVLVADLGLGLDVEATLDDALAASTLADRVYRLLGQRDRVQILPYVSLDSAVAGRWFEALSPQLAVAPLDARLHVVEGVAQVVPAAPGRALDVQQTVEALSAQRGRLLQGGGRLALVTKAVPPTVSDLGPVAEQVNAWLAQPLTIRAYDPIADESLWWTAPPAVWGTWMALHVDPVQLTFDWTLDLEAVRAYLAEHAAALQPDRYADVMAAVEAVGEAFAGGEWQVTLRLYHTPSQYVVQHGETLASIARDHGFPYPWLQQANPGVESLRPGQVIAIPSPDELLPLPVVMHKRIVISISQQRMWAYEWENLVWAWTVSTGIESSPTSPGVFQIQSHDPNAYAASWDLWMPYFMGIYRPVPTANFMNGFHGFPTRDGANLLWTGSLGHPVTYGCILLSTSNAALLYEWAEAGVVVEIQP